MDTVKVNTAEEANKEALEYALKRIDELRAENEKLKAFKVYVHDRLDKMGIPSDPEPENNLVHGCRIEGRLNVLQDKASEQHP